MHRKAYFKEWRKHRGLTLEAAAQSAEMTAGNISAIERGAQGYTQRALEALAAAYDTEPASVLSVDPTLNGSREIPLAGAKSQRRRTFIKEWREHRGLTQEQLANQVGWSVSNVSQLERGLQGYSQEGLEAIADALLCDPGELLSKEDPGGVEEGDDKPQARPFYLREWRKFKSVRADDLAAALGIERQSYHRLEKNWWTISVRDIGVLAERIGIEPWEFWLRDVNRASAPDLELALRLIAAIRQ